MSVSTAMNGNDRSSMDKYFLFTSQFHSQWKTALWRKPKAAKRNCGAAMASGHLLCKQQDHPDCSEFPTQVPLWICLKTHVDIIRFTACSISHPLYNPEKGRSASKSPRSSKLLKKHQKTAQTPPKKTWLGAMKSESCFNMFPNYWLSFQIHAV